MATASKSRRPVMVTPPRQTQAKSGASTNANVYTVEERQQLLDNFDLEVADKIRSFESHLALTLQSFVLRQDSELFRIPRELRTMTLRDLRASWGGSLAGTVMKLKRDRIEVEERARLEREEEERKAMEKEAKGKRKWEEGNVSPGRSSKNARKNASTTKGSTAAVKRKPTLGKKGKSAPTRLSSSQPSGLPQDHVFNPLLPPTPRMPRAPRRGESFLSVNGSPLAHNVDDVGESSEDEEEDEDDGELPDPEAYAAKITSKSTRKTAPPKTKRAPSLMIRQSLAPAASRNHTSDREESSANAENGLASIALKDGRVISFNPLDLDPGRIEAEMRESGLNDADREDIRAKIKEEVVKALSERMERWSGMR